MLALDFVSVTLNFLGTSRGNQEKLLDDILVLVVAVMVGHTVTGQLFVWTVT